MFYILSSKEYLDSTTNYQLAAELKLLQVPTTVIDWRKHKPANGDSAVFYSCWDYHVHYREFTAYLDSLAENEITTINKLPLIKWNLDKRYLLNLRDACISIPLTHICSPADAIEKTRIVLERADKVIIKPTISASAYKTHLVCNIDHLPAILSDFESNVIIQEYIEEITTEGELSLVFFNLMFSHAVAKKPRLNDYRVQIKYGGTYKTIEVTHDIIAFGESVLMAAVRVTGYTPLYARVDVVKHNKGLYLMELELIEPNLFLDTEEKALNIFAKFLAETIHKI